MSQRTAQVTRTSKETEYFLCGTAHIDVDNFSTIGYINCCSVGHF